jgi:hypothetical protein
MKYWKRKYYSFNPSLVNQIKDMALCISIITDPPVCAMINSAGMIFSEVMDKERRGKISEFTGAVMAIF